MVRLNRRNFCKVSALGGAKVLSGLTFAGLTTKVAATQDSQDNTKANYLRKTIPSSKEPLNVVGMGTWQTFNVGGDKKLRDDRAYVLKTFFERGGQIVDSSPMYGSSQDVMGYCLNKLNFPSELFAADKIWTGDGDATEEDMRESLEKWQLKNFTLLQVHNLVSWQEHLPQLQALKQAGKLKYVGVTTSHGRRHDELEKIMRTQDLDFVQLTYNMTHREAEQRLLPLAQDKGIAVIANRPFDGGPLVDKLKASSHSVPDWAFELGCKNWPQFLLKFIVSHPAVTCAIPATTKVVHMKENMGALLGPLPDQLQRREMLTYLQSLAL